MVEVKHVAAEGKSGKAMKFRGWRRDISVVVCTFLCSGGHAATNDFKLGEVRVSPSELAISFPAQVNQRTGLVEYLVVHETGKVHESIFRTEVGGQQIQAAALLFAEKGATATNAQPKLKNIQVTWTENGADKKFTAAELILDKKKKRALGETKWAYRGSRLIDGVFLAQRDGSLIAIMEDRDALVDQATPDASDDENWEPLTEKIPAIATPVTITLVFEGGSK
jgi:hypothetical protein